MKEQLALGLPLETWVIVGGLFLLATFLPSIVALILRYREEKK